jgi:NTE family protein
MKSICLALGGGGARGFAHIGALKVLQREKIPISRIVGTSMGAVIGAMYAQYKDIDIVLQKFHDLFSSPIFKSSGMSFVDQQRVAEGWFYQLAEHVQDHIVINLGKHTKSVASVKRLYDVLAFLLLDEAIEFTKIPFAAVATDLHLGTEVILNAGPVIKAVAASSALPGFLPPVKIDGRLLIDGASTSPVPIRAAKKLSKSKIVAVDVSQTLTKEPKLDNLVDIVLRSYSITARHYHDELVQDADLLIQPLVGRFHWSQFENINLVIQEGERTMAQSLGDLYRLCHPDKASSPHHT